MMKELVQLAFWVFFNDDGDSNVTKVVVMFVL